MSKKLLSILIVILIIAIAAIGCSKEAADGNKGSSGENNSTGEVRKAEAPLEISIFAAEWRDEEAINNTHDIVTPYIEEKMNVKIKEVLVANSQSFKERINQWIATNSLPDVVIASNASADYATYTGEFAELSEYIDDMPNFKKYFEDKYWPNFTRNGEIHRLPQVGVNLGIAPYEDDPYVTGPGGHALWAREDILAKAGYSFTPIAELKKITDAGGKPKAADFAITPAVDTPEKFFEMLEKIKALNLKVGDRPIIPFSIPSWAQFHLGSIYDFGHWRINEKGDVDGFLGMPEAKEFYQYLNKLYRAELIDKDFIIQQEQQIQEKVASGMVAVGMYVPNIQAAREVMAEVNPEATIRYIPWPKKHELLGFFDIHQGAYHTILVRKDFKDIGRLMQFLDWTISEEGLLDQTWGPEDSGLWELKDGKRVWVDEDLKNYAMFDTVVEKGPSYYGLYDHQISFRSHLAPISLASSLGFNPQSYLRSYEPRLNIIDLNKAYAGRTGMDYAGIASYGDGGDNAIAVSDFFWSFQNTDAAKLLVPTTTEDFDRAWDEIYQSLLREADYEAAVKDMTKWFESLK